MIEVVSLLVARLEKHYIDAIYRVANIDFGWLFMLSNSNQFQKITMRDNTFSVYQGKGYCNMGIHDNQGHVYLNI